MAVLAAIALVVVMVTRGGGGPGGGGGSPAEAVQGYLEALSRGDAQAALAYSAEEPGSTDLLTDEVLKQQIAQWPITNIRILSGEATTAIATAVVHVAATFGDKVSDTQLQLTRSGDRWLLKSAAVKLDPGSMIQASRTLTVFGKPVGQGQHCRTPPSRRVPSIQRTHRPHRCPARTC